MQQQSLQEQNTLALALDVAKQRGDELARRNVQLENDLASTSATLVQTQTLHTACQTELRDAVNARHQLEVSSHNMISNVCHLPGHLTLVCFHLGHFP